MSKVVEGGAAASSGPAKSSNNPVRGIIVEDTGVSGGVTSEGAPVVAPKNAEGKVSESVRPTDSREGVSS